MLKEFESHTGTASKGAAIGVATFRKHVRSMVKTTLDPRPNGRERKRVGLPCGVLNKVVLVAEKKTGFKLSYL